MLKASFTIFKGTSSNRSVSNSTRIASIKPNFTILQSRIHYFFNLWRFSNLFTVFWSLHKAGLLCAAVGHLAIFINLTAITSIVPDFTVFQSFSFCVFLLTYRFFIFNTISLLLARKYSLAICRHFVIVTVGAIDLAHFWNIQVALDTW